MNHLGKNLYTLAHLSTLSLALLSGNALATLFPMYPTRVDGVVNANEWALDRYAPRVWQNDGTQFGRVDVLKIGVDALDGPTTRPAPFNVTFYNLQGRGVAFPTVQGAGSTIAGSFYLPASWNQVNVGDTALNRRTDLFVQLTPLSNDNGACSGTDECIYYGGLGFSNAQLIDQTAGGGPPRIRILKKGAGDGWVNLTNPYRVDAWNDVCISYTGNTLEYFLNGQSVYVDSTLTTPNIINGPVNRLRVALVSDYNFGSTYDARWADLEYGQRASLVMSRSTPIAAPAGGSISYSTTVTNTGAASASGVQVIEPISTGLTLISVSGACTALPCNLGTLAAGASATYVSTYTISAANGTALSNRALIRTSSIDCDKADNSIVRTINVGAAPISTVQAPSLNQMGMLILMVGLAGLAAHSSRKQGT
jgi:uncharacterized repeat protein (TIGR01451 family)